MSVVIILNTAILASTHYGQTKEWGDFIETANYGFLLIYVLEMVGKIQAFGLQQYMNNPWNLFDGWIVLVSALLHMSIADKFALHIHQIQTFAWT